MTDSAKPHYLGHRKRLKEKLVNNSRGLADYEIMELVLATVLPRRDTKPLAKELIARFGSLKEAIMARPDQLDGVKGVADGVKAQWALLQELYARLNQASARRGNSFEGVEDVAKAAMARLGSKGIEEFWVVYLDNKNRYISWEQIATGTVNATAVFPREIMALALRQEAASLILIHNHPGGSIRPSGEDMLLTGSIVEAAEKLDLKVLDHIVVTDCDYYSFSDHGRI
ncbi:RadC family protein [Pseudodesulfovibrio sediminis]|uniref:DNA repair protein RadC n=1 Tax=Pseudodesulfovibrio sediminis TaxID=2810563 RepID=A0ABM9SDU1_9BACT|nr:DNA repair protein RadC [Pseudodesulfovibrio sediminis]BCS89665.1 DNA repair protein RadC [Pseudodesulfovibrio sediminis]